MSNVTMVVFADGFEECYIFAVMMNPSEVWRLIFQTISVKLEMKIYENDRMSSKMSVLPNTPAK